MTYLSVVKSLLVCEAEGCNALSDFSPELLRALGEPGTFILTGLQCAA